MMKINRSRKHEELLTCGPIVVAASCWGVNGAGGGEYFNHGFASFCDENFGFGGG